MCAVLCCTALCCAALCCVALRFAVLCCAVFKQKVVIFNCIFHKLRLELSREQAFIIFPWFIVHLCSDLKVSYLCEHRQKLCLQKTHRPTRVLLFLMLYHLHEIWIMWHILPPPHFLKDCDLIHHHWRNFKSIKCELEAYVYYCAVCCDGICQ